MEMPRARDNGNRSSASLVRNETHSLKRWRSFIYWATLLRKNPFVKRNHVEEFSECDKQLNESKLSGEHHSRWNISWMWQVDEPKYAKSFRRSVSLCFPVSCCALSTSAKQFTVKQRTGPLPMHVLMIQKSESFHQVICYLGLPAYNHVSCWCDHNEFPPLRMTNCNTCMPSLRRKSKVVLEYTGSRIFAVSGIFQQPPTWPVSVLC